MKKQTVDEKLDELGDWHATFPGRTASDVVKLLQARNDACYRLQSEVAELKKQLSALLFFAPHGGQ